jgi:hypothetical protein
MNSKKGRMPVGLQQAAALCNCGYCKTMHGALTAGVREKLRDSERLILKNEAVAHVGMNEGQFERVVSLKPDSQLPPTKLPSMKSVLAM